MEKSYKIILSCVCIALVFALLGFGIGRMTDTSPATDSNQTINVGDTENETWDSNPKNSVDNTESETKDNSQRNNVGNTRDGENSIKIIQDGKEWTIIVDPSVVGDDFDWGNYGDIGITGDHE